MNRLAVLVGNGLSIAYNPALSVPQLTAGIVSRFEGAAGSQAGDALRRVARRINGTKRTDFEALLGPLDSVATALAALRDVTNLSAKATETDIAIRRTGRFLSEIHKVGLSEALALVASRAHGQGDQQFTDTAVAFAAAIAGLGAVSPITIANLSYDGLAQAGLLRANVGMADLADGRRPCVVEVRRNWPVPGYHLRTTDDLPLARVHLLQLHGSIGWLRNSAGDAVKCEIEELRAANFWRRAGGPRSMHTPAVVLTDRKEGAVALEPFSLAYRIFTERLVTSEHWLVAGYSFGDVPVNRAFRRAIQLRRALGESDPTVLVIGRGKAELLSLQARRSGIASASLTATGLGLPKALTGRRWRAWAS